MTITPARRSEPSLPNGCRVTSAVHGGIPGFHIYGALDHRTAAHVRSVLDAAVGEASMLVDLSGVDSIDHAGMDAIMGAIGRASDGGVCAAIAATSPAILALLRARDLNPAIQVMATPIEALGWLDTRRRSSPGIDPTARVRDESGHEPRHDGSRTTGSRRSAPLRVDEEIKHLADGPLPPD